MTYRIGKIRMPITVIKAHRWSTNQLSKIASAAFLAQVHVIMIFELTRILHLKDYKGKIPITPIARWISLDSHIDTLYAFAKKVVSYKKPSLASTIHLSTKCKRILFLLYRRTMKMQICSTVNIVMNIYEVQCHMHANEVDLKYI